MVPLLVESWLWWSLVIVVAACRFIARRIVLGSLRKYQVDDYLMVVVLAFYTTLIATINIVRHTSSNLLPPGFDVNTLTQSEIKARMYGSKLILVVEQSQCVTVWGAKLCLIILYLRLTTLRWENIAIRVLAGYVIGSFIIMDILYFGVWCRPFHEYWAVPTNSTQCDAATDHLITNAVFNLSSDCAMLAIGLPMFLRMNLPWRKKIPLVAVFSLGLFVILAAILNKVYSFADPFGSLWTFWYVRESSTALLVANLPFVWTIWRKLVGSHTFFGQHMGSYGDEDGSDEGSKHETVTSSKRRSGITAVSERKQMEIEFKRAPTLEHWLSGGDTGALARTATRQSGSGMLPSEPAPVATVKPETAGWSLADMLEDGGNFRPVTRTTSNVAATEAEESRLEAEELDPITHPALFYSRARASTTTRFPTTATTGTSVTEASNAAAAAHPAPGPSNSSPEKLAARMSLAHWGESDGREVVEEPQQTPSLPPSSGSRKSMHSVL